MNIQDLREEMVAVFNKLKKQEIEPKVAHEFSNAAGKILNTVIVQLKYSAQRNEQPDIPFLNVKK